MINYLPISESFFGPDGITSTSANHLANLAKQRYEALATTLGEIKFVTEKFGLIGQPEEAFTISSVANGQCNVELYVSILDKISAYKGFIAFLREAIKHKRDLEQDALAARDPEIKNIPTKDFPSKMDVSEYLLRLPIKEREHYLSLEAKCATYGKFIHPDGPFYIGRKKLLKALAEPRHVDYNGKDTIIKIAEPTYPIEHVDQVLDHLQAIHRAAEAEFNGIKSTIEQNILKKYNDDLAEYRKANEEHNAKMRAILLAEEESHKERLELIRNLKIQIPNKYKEIYYELTQKTN